MIYYLVAFGDVIFGAALLLLLAKSHDLWRLSLVLRLGLWLLASGALFQSFKTMYYVHVGAEVVELLPPLWVTKDIGIWFITVAGWRKYLHKTTCPMEPDHG